MRTGQRIADRTHLAALRAIPGLDVVRPADANETGRVASDLKNNDWPAGLALTRQAVPIYPRGEDGFADTFEVAKGGYILKDCDGTPDVILMGTGRRYVVAAAARRARHRWARVVSMPCREWFDEQDQGYKDSALIPPEIKARVSIEAGVGIGWRDLVGDAGRIISINHYEPARPRVTCSRSSVSLPKRSSQPPKRAFDAPPGDYRSHASGSQRAQGGPADVEATGVTISQEQLTPPLLIQENRS